MAGGERDEVREALDGDRVAVADEVLDGPRSRVISNLRILGPCRNLNQVELAYTDAIALGFEIPLRLSGNIEGTPGCMLMGPAGFFEMTHGVIRAKRHVHMGPGDAKFYGVKHLDRITLKVTSAYCNTRFDDLIVRVDPSFKLEVHMDTDESNACDLERATKVELIKS